MKIIIVGATGTLGTKVAETFAQKHEIIRVGNTKGDVQVKPCLSRLVLLMP